MNDFGVVILNKHPRFALSLLESIFKHHGTRIPEIVIVRDGHQEVYQSNGHNVSLLNGVQPFCYARNVNLGINWLGTKDVILINDDCTIVEEDFFYKLRLRAEHHKSCGLMSPMVDGGVGNWYQSWGRKTELWRHYPDEIGIGGSNPVCFVCCYIKRSLIDEIGLLDENFTGYGFEDNDYCLRARQKQRLTMITRLYRVVHGNGGTVLDRGSNWSCSFAQEPQEIPNNMEYFLSKYPHLRKTA